MEQYGWAKQWQHRACLVLVTICAGGLMNFGCARLPYTTQTVHEDQRVAVMLQHEVSAASYSHPVHLTPPQLAAILRGLSLREQQRLPLRWYAEEAPPNKAFREDELEALVPSLAAGLEKAGTVERVSFQVFGPGMNPRYRRDVTAGWLAVRDRYLHITMEYFHVQQPVTKEDAYDYNYPTPWTPPKTYLLYFEPGRFYVTDPATQTLAVDYREFLKTVQ